MRAGEISNAVRGVVKVREIRGGKVRGNEEWGGRGIEEK